MKPFLRMLVISVVSFSLVGMEKKLTDSEIENGCKAFDALVGWKKDLATTNAEQPLADIKKFLAVSTFANVFKENYCNGMVETRDEVSCIISKGTKKASLLMVKGMLKIAFLKHSESQGLKAIIEEQNFRMNVLLMETPKTLDLRVGVCKSENGNTHQFYTLFFKE